VFRQKKDKPARRWWQHLVRLAALLCVVLAVGYATLPYWAPTGLIRRHLAEVMSRQMGTAVRIGDMSLSWSQGVDLRDLEIDSPAGFAPGAMVRVGHIRAEFSPVEFFLHDRIGWMEIARPEAFIQVDRDGNVNIAALSKLHFDAQAERISVSQATVSIQLPDDDKLLVIGVSDARYLAGRIRNLGRLTVSAMLKQDDTTAPISLRMAAGGADRPVLADALFNFSNVDLAQLPLARLLSLPLAGLSGRCRGSVNLQINRRGVVDQFSVELGIDNLEVRPTSGPALPVIPQAGFRIAAAFDPVAKDLQTGLVNIQSASVRLPGIDLAAKASVTTDVFGGRWQGINSLALSGNVYPDRLAAMLTGRQQLPGEHGRPAGRQHHAEQKQYGLHRAGGRNGGCDADHARRQARQAGRSNRPIESRRQAGQPGLAPRGG